MSRVPYQLEGYQHLDEAVEEQLPELLKTDEHLRYRVAEMKHARIALETYVKTLDI